MNGLSRESNRSKREKNYRDIAIALSRGSLLIILTGVEQSTPIFDSETYFGRGLYVDASESNRPLSRRNDGNTHNEIPSSPQSNASFLKSVDSMLYGPTSNVACFFEDSELSSLCQVSFCMSIETRV